MMESDLFPPFDNFTTMFIQGWSNTAVSKRIITAHIFEVVGGVVFFPIAAPKDG